MLFCYLEEINKHFVEKRKPKEKARFPLIFPFYLLSLQKIFKYNVKMTRHDNACFSLLSGRSLAVIAMLMTVMGTMAENHVEKLLTQFDQQPETATANHFFAELEKADFTGQTIAFPEDTTADSLQQQVWYWAAEWLYDQQQYSRAEQYALKTVKKYHPQNPELADCQNTLACIYTRLSDFKRAAEYARQSVESRLNSARWATTTPTPSP